MSNNPIPVVDFEKARGGDGYGDGGKEEVAKEIDRAFREVGFVYLKNHGIEKEVVREAFEWSKEFFNLPLETKMLAPHPPGGAHHRGYSAPGLEKVSQHMYDEAELNKVRDVPDYKESFESGNVKDSAQPNIWLPDDIEKEVLPGFRAFMQRFFVECEGLVRRILDTLSIALQVPKPGLSPTHSQSLFQLRLLHYPSIAASELSEGKRSRINAHSDFGTLTLLFQDSVGGLEIEDPNSPDTFRPATPIPDTVLVNVGDLMARWSNDRWKSTIHRVGIPQGNAEGIVPDRYSIPFFATADPTTVIDALPGCWGEGNEKKYEAVTAEGYVRMRMEALYK